LPESLLFHPPSVLLAKRVAKFELKF